MLSFTVSLSTTLNHMYISHMHMQFYMYISHMHMQFHMYMYTNIQHIMYCTKLLSSSYHRVPFRGELNLWEGGGGRGGGVYAPFLY